MTKPEESRNDPNVDANLPRSARTWRCGCQARRLGPVSDGGLCLGEHVIPVRSTRSHTKLCDDETQERLEGDPLSREVGPPNPCVPDSRAGAEVEMGKR